MKIIDKALVETFIVAPITITKFYFLTDSKYFNRIIKNELEYVYNANLCYCITTKEFIYSKYKLPSFFENPLNYYSVLKIKVNPEIMKRDSKHKYFKSLLKSANFIKSLEAHKEANKLVRIILTYDLDVSNFLIIEEKLTVAQLKEVKEETLNSFK